MSNSENRLFLRSYGAVIPATAIETILFTTWKETSYSIDRSERTINPMVLTTERVHASAILYVSDPRIAKQLVPEDEEEEEEEEDEKPKRRRGRPAKKEVVEVFEPLEIEIVFFKKEMIVAAEPLNIATPIRETMEISDKNERVVAGRINHYGGLFSQLEGIRENLQNDVANTSNELAAVVDDMVPEGGNRLMGLQQSAVEEYRAKQRRMESRVIAEIDESLNKFQEMIARRGYTTEAVPLTGNIEGGDKTITALEIVNSFFTEELISME